MENGRNKDFRNRIYTHHGEKRNQGELCKVTKYTMLLNESMVKLAKYYNGDENWDTYLNQVKLADEKYASILGKLYVSKVNKNPKDVSEYRRLNYQLLTALALSKQDYMNLLQEDMRVYKKILKPFEIDAEKDEWITNIDYIGIQRHWQCCLVSWIRKVTILNLLALNGMKQRNY